MGKRNHLVTDDEDNTALIIHKATTNNHYLAKNLQQVLSAILEPEIQKGSIQQKLLVFSLQKNYPP